MTFTFTLYFTFFLHFTFLCHFRRYDPLIEAQARELTCLRQKIHEGKGVCHLFTQHAKNTIKTSESFLKSTGITYYQRQRYCEPLAQGSQLAERLASKLSTGKLSYRLWEHLAPPEVLTSRETPHLHNSFSDVVARCPAVLWCSQLQDSFPGGSAGKEPACQCRRYRRGFAPWVRRIPWRRKWQPSPEWRYQLEIPGRPTLGPRRASTDIFQKVANVVTGLTLVVLMIARYTSGRTIRELWKTWGISLTFPRWYTAHPGLPSEVRVCLPVKTGRQHRAVVLPNLRRGWGA